MVVCGVILPQVVFTALVIIVICASLADGEFPTESDFPEAPPIQYSTLSGPSFLNTTSSVRVVSGTTAKLPCGVKNLHNYTVSWVRGRDIRLLTTSSITYTSDSRFVISNPSGGQQWILKIHYVRISDAGAYLCQVSTTPPITHTVDLLVQEAVARVLPGSEVHVQTGSRMEVICQVEGCPTPALISWTRSGYAVLTPEVISYDIATENGTSPVSELLLAHTHATPAHSGTYTCTSKCTQPVNVTVHVLKGEELAAMQHVNKSSQMASDCHHVFVFIIVTQLTALLLSLWREDVASRPLSNLPTERDQRSSFFHTSLQRGNHLTGTSH